MLHLFIKSTICFALLFAFYKFFLEREKMPDFNRFYLLGILVLSLVVPNCNFNVESSNIITLNSVANSATNSLILENFTTTLLIVYVIGVFVFSIRFIRNVLIIYQRIKDNIHKKDRGFTLVMIEEKLLPHTFFNYVFINRNDYEKKKIQEELFTHEYLHANEKHSVDIIVTELFQIAF